MKTQDIVTLSEQGAFPDFLSNKWRGRYSPLKQARRLAIDCQMTGEIFVFVGTVCFFLSVLMVYRTYVGDQDVVYFGTGIGSLFFLPACILALIAQRRKVVFETGKNEFGYDINQLASLLEWTVGKMLISGHEAVRQRTHEMLVKHVAKQVTLEMKKEMLPEGTASTDRDSLDDAIAVAKGEFERRFRTADRFALADRKGGYWIYYQEARAQLENKESPTSGVRTSVDKTSTESSGKSIVFA